MFLIPPNAPPTTPSPPTNPVSTITLKTNVVEDALVPFLIKNLNAYGEISFSYQFQSAPSLTIKMVSDLTEGEIKQKYSPSATTTFLVLNKLYRIKTLKITKLSREKYNTDKILTTIELVGVNSEYASPSRNKLDFPYTREDEEDEHASNKRTQVKDEALVKGHFVYMGTDTVGLETRPFGQTNTTTLSPLDILSDNITFSYNGAGAEVDRVPLAIEYRNLKLEPPTEDERNLSKIVRVEYENALDLGDFGSSYPTGLSTVNATKYDKECYDPNNTFDNSGRTKLQRTITEIAGEEISKFEITKGLVFTSMDTYHLYDISDDPKTQIWGHTKKENPVPNLMNFWKNVITSNYRSVYDSDGFLVKKISSTRRVVRVKQESSSIEAIKQDAKAKNFWNAVFGPGRPLGKAERILEDKYQKMVSLRESYLFSQSIPLNKISVYNTELFSKYYADIKKEEEKELSKSDPEPPSRFVRKKIDKTIDLIVNKNPLETTDDKSIDKYTPYEPVLQKNEKITIEETIILIPESAKAQTTTPEKFRRLSYTKTTEGESGQIFAEDAQSGSVAGRPSPHSRLDLSTKNTKSDYDFDKDKIYYLNTIDSIPPDASGTGITETPIPVPEGAFSNPQAFNITQLKKAADTKLAIDATINSSEATMKVTKEVGLYMSEGDCIIWENKKYLIKSINFTFEVEQGLCTCDGVELNISQLLIPQTIMKTYDV